MIMWKIDKYEDLRGEEINILQVKNIPNIKGQIMQQAKFAYCSLGKALEKWTEKQVGAIESLTKPF